MKADRFKEFPTQEDMNLGFEQGFDAIVEHQRGLSRHITRSSIDPCCAHVYKNYIV